MIPSQGPQKVRAVGGVTVVDAISGPAAYL